MQVGRRDSSPVAQANNVDRPVSLTEQVYTSDLYLNWLYPSNCVMTRIHTKDYISRTEGFGSILSLLSQFKFDPIATAEKTSNLHRCLKPVRCIGRIAFAALIVTPFVAPAGVSYHGVRTLDFFLRYCFSVLMKSENANKNWEKMGQHIQAFFSDFSAFCIGALACVTLKCIACVLVPEMILYYSTLTIFQLTIGVALSTFGAYMSCLALGIDPSQSIPMTVSYEGQRTSMYLALALRNRLGLVNENGGLLPFFDQDRLTASISSEQFVFSGADTAFWRLIERHEAEILSYLRQINQILNGSGISAQSVTWSVESFESEIEKRWQAQFGVVSSGGLDISVFATDQNRLYRLFVEAKIAHRKLHLLREFHKTAREMAVNGGFCQQFMAMLARKESWSWERVGMTREGQPTWYYGQHDTRTGFSSSSSSGASASSHAGPAPAGPSFKDMTGLSEILRGSSIPAVDPTGIEAPDVNDIYKTFKYRVETQKYYYEKKENVDLQPLSLHEFLGLAKDFTRANLVQAYRRYALAMHPDKNGSTDEAKHLFQTLENINVALKEELEKREAFEERLKRASK